MRIVVLLGVVAAAALVAVGASFAVSSKGGNGRDASASLNGYNEVPLSLSSPARGDFRARIDNGTIKYRLRYSGFDSTVVQAHIHLGQLHTAGGVSAFLCGGGGKPACPSPGGTVEGTIVAADVIGPAGQGIAAGQFDELVSAIRAGATYANVHSATYPGGEIRGQIKGRGFGKHDDDD
jgi:CHRD domain-containing protein